MTLMVAWACLLGDGPGSFENWPGVYSDTPPCTLVEWLLLDEPQTCKHQ